MIVSALILAAAAASTPPTVPTCIVPDGTRVTLELATTDKDREMGLMFRDSLKPDAGMLFIFDKEGLYPFWMKNTFIALDMVWLDAAGRVVFVHADVPPCHRDPCPSYSPRAAGRAVLELNSGFAAKHAITVGSQLRFEGMVGYPVAGGGK